MEAIPAPAPRRGQPQAAAPRRRQVLVRLSDSDLSAIKVGASREGLAIGAWLRGPGEQRGLGPGRVAGRCRCAAGAGTGRHRFILDAADVPAVSDRAMAALLRLDTLIGDAAQ